MDKINCEEFLMSKMAEIDGEETQIFAEQTKAHLVSCENCQNQFEEMQIFVNRLKRQKRNNPNPHLWSAIEKRIGVRKTSKVNRKPFVLIGVLLFACKLLEILPEDDPGLAFRFIPLIFVVALFVLIKENPFKINAELSLEK